MAGNGARLKLFAGNASKELAGRIAEKAGIHLGEIEVAHFSDGEVKVIIKESVRGDDVYVVQSTCSPVNNNLMELLIIVDAIRRASARRITVVIPYYGYGRQDRKTRGREPITAKLVANLVGVAGANRVLTMDLHAPQIQGFFDLPLDHLTAVPLMAKYFSSLNLPDPVVVSPDVGGVTRARVMAEQLGSPIVIVDKRRPETNIAEVLNIIGDFGGKTAIIIDDMVDTAGSIVQVAAALLANGARSVYGCCTHPVLSGPAIERINRSPLEELVVTDTIPVVSPLECPKINVLSVAPIIGEAIVRIHMDMSVSELFR